MLESAAVLKRVDRLVMVELIPPFLFALFAFIILIVGAALLKPLLSFLIRYGVGADVFFAMLFLSLPQWIVFTFPMAMLTGTLLAVGRLSGDAEITALRAAGINLYRITWPILYFALVLALATFILNEWIAPYTNHQLEVLKQRIIREKTGTVKEAKVSLPFYRKGYLSYLLVAESLEGERLENLNLLSFDPQTHETTWHLSAETSSWTGKEWKFYDGKVYNFLEEGVVTTRFQEWNVPEFDLSPATIAERSKDPMELSVFDLRRLIHYQQEAGLDISIIRRFQTDYYFKFSIPFASLFFVLIGVPLAIIPQRASTSMGLGFSLLIVLGYFFLYTVAVQMGRGDVVHPAFAAWIPNLSVFLAGMGLLRVRNR